jgi:hypothetical protein
MKYLKVEWVHEFMNEPMLICSEIDEHRNEIRKIEMFRDGRVGYANNEIEYGGSALSEWPLPEIDEIALDDQFKPTEISKEYFEKIWEECTRGKDGCLR